MERDAGTQDSTQHNTTQHNTTQRSNQLVIVGGSILLAKEQTVVLSTYSLLRDIAFYAVTLAVLVAVFVDGNVYAWEASFFLVCFSLF